MTVSIAHSADDSTADFADSALTTIAHFGKAIGDPLRLDVLRLLRTESLGVLELTHLLDTRQSGVSHHLKVLANAGLVSTRREGNSIFYRRALPAGSACQTLIQTLFDMLDETPLPAAYQKRLQQVREARAQQARAFFSRHAQQFRHHQELIAEHQLYAQAVLEMLALTDISAHHTVLELGPGEGLFLPELSRRFDRVIALDNSLVMLEQAKQYGHSHKLNNIEFRLGELALLADEELQVDCIIANMVLHHVPDPAAIFRQAATLLRPDASLFISELSHHDQTWVKQTCGDLWLGFSADQLDNWADQAQLIRGDAQYLGLRNGFQIQIRQFFRKA